MGCRRWTCGGAGNLFGFYNEVCGCRCAMIRAAAKVGGAVVGGARARVRSASANSGLVLRAVPAHSRPKNRVEWRGLSSGGRGAAMRQGDGFPGALLVPAFALGAVVLTGMSSKNTGYSTDIQQGLKKIDDAPAGDQPSPLQISST